ncbi:MAG: hypothetical protein RLZZ01_567 [Actinomycetota bacterium]|jgi:type II secretory pathway component PulF
MTTSATTSTSAPGDGSAPRRSAADRAMRRLLRLDESRTATAADARKAFQTSVMVAAVRCLIMYILLPFVVPAIGLAAGVGPWIGLPIAVAAIVAVTMSIRRFWRADHSKRWHYTAVGSIVIGFMVFEIVRDLAEILG